jgi:hypothetical protein
LSQISLHHIIIYCKDSSFFYHDSTFHINNTKASRILNDTTGFKHHSENPAIAASAFPLLSDSTPAQSDRQTSLTPEVA